jgi:hypothetical protein
MGRFVQFLAESAIYDKMDDARRVNDPVDRAIAMYTLDPTYKFEIDDVIEDAIERYGNDSAMTVYRGLNFSSKEDFDKFMGDANDGNVNFDSISSWAPTRGIAHQFAVTKPSYMEFMSPEAWGEIAKQSKTRERIAGYRGVILSTEIKPNTAVDVYQSEYGKEREFILPAGSYSVEVEQILTYKDTMATSSVDAEIEKLVKSGASKGDATKFLEYLFAHHPNEFSDKSKAHVGKIIDIEPFRYHINVERQDDRGVFNERDHLSIGTVALERITPLLPFLLPKDVERIKRQSRPIFLKMLKEIEELYEPGMTINWRHGQPGDAAEMLGVRQEFINTIRRTVGKTYGDTTGTEHNRSIQTTADVRKEADRIVALLKSFG